jgi:hypothetical protein
MREGSTVRSDKDDVVITSVESGRAAHNTAVKAPVVHVRMYICMCVRVKVCKEQRGRKGQKKETRKKEWVSIC